MNAEEWRFWLLYKPTINLPIISENELKIEVLIFSNSYLGTKRALLEKQKQNLFFHLCHPMFTTDSPEFWLRQKKDPDQENWDQRKFQP